jgi:hypothetical protein
MINKMSAPAGTTSKEINNYEEYLLALLEVEVQTRDENQYLSMESCDDSNSRYIERLFKIR